MMRGLLVWSVALCAAAAGACGSDNEDDGHSGSLPAYVLSSSDWTLDEPVTYFGFLSALDGEATVDRDRVIEVPGANTLIGRDGDAVFSVGVEESSIVRRFEFDGDGKPIEVGSFSLANTGVSSLGSFVIVSSTKGYFLDSRQGKVVVWNPEQMALTGELDIPTVKDGFSSACSQVALTDSRLYLACRWFNWDTEVAHPAMGLLVIDTSEDRVAAFEEDDRCRQAESSVVADNGDMYLMSGFPTAFQWRYMESGVSPCMLRVRADALDFDPDFSVADLAAVVGGHAASLIAPAGGTEAFINVLHEDRVSGVTPQTTLGELYEQVAWRWWKVDLANLAPGSGVELAGVPFSAGGNYPLIVDGKTYIKNLSEDFATTRLYEVPEESGETRLVLETFGQVDQMIRVGGAR
jgi:hypothetical protein